MSGSSDRDIDRETSQRDKSNQKAVNIKQNMPHKVREIKNQPVRQQNSTDHKEEPTSKNKSIRRRSLEMVATTAKSIIRVPTYRLKGGKESIFADDGQRYLAKFGSHKNTPKPKYGMEAKIKTMLREFKTRPNSKAFTQTKFAAHWVESVEHHISMIEFHTKMSGLETRVQHLWRAFVREVDKDDDTPVGMVISPSPSLDLGLDDNLEYRIYRSSSDSRLHEGEVATQAPESLPATEYWRKDPTGTFLLNKLDPGNVRYCATFESLLASGVNGEDANNEIALKLCKTHGEDIESVRFKMHKSYFNNEVIVAKPPFSVSKLAWSPSSIDIEITLKEYFYPRVFHMNHVVSFDAAETSTLVKLVTHDTREKEKEQIKSRKNSKRKPGQRKSSRFSFFNKQKKKRVTRLEHQIFLEIGNQYAKIDEIQNSSILESVKSKMKEKSNNTMKSVENGKLIVRGALTMGKFMDRKEGSNKQIALGAIMANILHETPSGKRGKLRNKSLERCYKMGKQRLRYIELNEDALKNGFADCMRNGLRNRLNGENSPLQLSTPVDQESGEASIDYFVSHCWTDNVDEKVYKLIKFSKYFYKQHKRYPRLWIDLFCVDQDVEEIETNIELLPVFLMACDRLLVLKSDVLSSRLWCLMEIYARGVMTDANLNSGDKIHLIDIGKDKTTGTARDVDCNLAACSNEEDSILLREKLNRCPGGISRVNTVISNAIATAKRMNHVIN